MALNLGIRLGLSRAPTGPVELVTNGGFDADTNWTKALGATISGGTLNVATATAFTAFGSQAIAMVSGGVYTLVYTISSLSVGGVIPTLSGGATVNFTTRTTTGTFTQSVTATANHTTLSFSSNTSGCTGSIDNVSLKRIS